MNPRRLLVFLAALLAVAVGMTGAVAAQTAGTSAGVRYEFSGKLLATPAPGAASVVVAVETGNRIALQKLVGQSQNQSFTVGSRTEYLKWHAGVPQVVSLTDLQAGDWVTVRVRAERSASLAEVVAQPARVVADRGPNPTFARRPLWLFIGTLASPAANGKIALSITSGNWKALHAMLGQPLQQTFTYDDGTIFLLWQGRVPTVISAEQLKVGDKITVRIRAPRAATLAQIESTPANHVGEHEPPPPAQE